MLNENESKELRPEKVQISKSIISLLKVEMSGYYNTLDSDGVSVKSGDTYLSDRRQWLW